MGIELVIQETVRDIVSVDSGGIALILQPRQNVIEVGLPTASTSSFGAGHRVSLLTDTTLAVSDSINEFNNTGASATVVATLPLGSDIGNSLWSAKFRVTASHTLRIKAQGSDVIRYSTAVSDPAGSLEAAEVGSVLDINYVGGGVYFVTQAFDVWEFA